jgi:glycosyltransferase involved in cell wall biosynthesis
VNADAERPERFPGVSVVVPVYNEAATIAQVYEDLTRVAQGFDGTYELVFVDDGSQDGTLELLRQVHARDPRVTVLSFTRNFGQRAAWTAGLSEARGEVVMTMDGDGQMEPGQLPLLLAAVAEGADIASGRRQGRKDPLLRLLTSRVSNWSLRRLAHLPVHDFGCSLRAYRGRMLDQLDFGPRRLFNKAAAMALTNAHVEIPVRHRARHRTRSRWGYDALLGFGVDNIITFGEHFFLRILLWALVGVAAAVALAAWAAVGVPLAPFVVPVVALMGALNVGAVALVGIAVSRAIRESSGRPCYVIRERLGAAGRDGD